MSYVFALAFGKALVHRFSCFNFSSVLRLSFFWQMTCSLHDLTFSHSWCPYALFQFLSGCRNYCSIIICCAFKQRLVYLNQRRPQLNSLTHFMFTFWVTANRMTLNKWRYIFVPWLMTALYFLFKLQRQLPEVFKLSVGVQVPQPEKFSVTFFHFSILLT